MKQQNFTQMISIPKGSKINILLKNEEFIEVILLDVKLDHIIVNMDDRIFYIAISHIQTLSKNAKDPHITKQLVPYLDRKHLTDLFDALKYNWVTINGLGNQTFNGLLSNISDDHIMLINDTEIRIIHKSFISNIYKGTYEPKEQHDDISSKEEVVLASPSFTDQKIKVTGELQDSQHDNQTIENQNSITNISESKTTTFIEKPEQEEKANHCIPNHHFRNQKSESIEKNQCEGNESDDISSKEEVVLASPSFTDQKIKVTEELQDSQHDNQTIENQNPIANISESKTTTFIEKPEQEEKANHCIPDHHFCNQKSESIEKNQCEGNESDDISSKEEVVLASPSFTDQKIKVTEELQDSQHDNQTIENQNPMANISESKTTTFIEKPEQEEKANHCIPDHHFCNQKSESIEKNQCEGNESDDISSKEEVVLASPSFTDQKIKETEELQNSQHDNETIETITSINELKQTVCIENGDQEVANHCIPHHQPTDQENECIEEYYYEFLEWHNGIMVKKKMYWSFHH